MFEEIKYDKNSEAEPFNNNNENRKYIFIDTKEIEKNPIYHRKLIFLDKEKEPENDDIVKITSYNILASKFLFKWVYGVISEYADFQYRSNNVLKELEYYDSDILCLQEVDNYDEFYKACFEKLGYDTIFKMKGKVGRYWLFSGVGAVLAYKKDKFELIDKKSLIYDNFDKDITNTGIEGIFALLKSKKTGSLILVSSTHTHWSSDEDFIQYGQVACLMHNINNFLVEKKLVDVPIVVCGDFNVRPHSNVIKFMKNQKPVVENVKSSLFCKTPKEKVLGIWEKYPNKYKFLSAYESPETGIYLAEYTHYHRFHKGVIDFIFHTENLKVKAVREMPNVVNLGDRAPNKIFPSDHLRIEAIFVLKNLLKKK